MAKENLPQPQAEITVQAPLEDPVLTAFRQQLVDVVRFKAQLISEHLKKLATDDPEENPILAGLREELTIAINAQATKGEKGLAHQVLVFANKLQDVANRAKRTVDAATAQNHPVISEMLTALNLAAKHLPEETPDGVKNAIHAAISKNTNG